MPFHECSVVIEYKHTKRDDKKIILRHEYDDTGSHRLVLVVGDRSVEGEWTIYEAIARVGIKSIIPESDVEYIAMTDYYGEACVAGIPLEKVGA